MVAATAVGRDVKARRDSIVSASPEMHHEWKWAAQSAARSSGPPDR
jgi:hypothetical protein